MKCIMVLSVKIKDQALVFTTVRRVINYDYMLTLFRLMNDIKVCSLEAMHFGNVFIDFQEIMLLQIVKKVADLTFELNILVGHTCITLIDLLRQQTDRSSKDLVYFSALSELGSFKHQSIIMVNKI